MRLVIHASSAVHARELNAAAAILRRIAGLTRILLPVLAGWLAKSSGATNPVALKLAVVAFLAALPLAWAFGVAADAVSASAQVAAHESETGVPAVNPLECRG